MNTFLPPLTVSVGVLQVNFYYVPVDRLTSKNLPSGPELLECNVGWAVLYLQTPQSALWALASLTIPAIHWHLAQHRQAHQDVVDESKTILHEVNHGVGEDTDVEALEESPPAVQPQEHEH